MADVEMNKGVQILLERMSSNPDEFIPTLRDGYPAKWRDILLSVVKTWLEPDRAGSTPAVFAAVGLLAALSQPAAPGTTHHHPGVVTAADPGLFAAGFVALCSA